MKARGPVDIRYLKVSHANFGFNQIKLNLWNCCYKNRSVCFGAHPSICSVLAAFFRFCVDRALQSRIPQRLTNRHSIGS